jgi:hypothetical protein
VISVRGSVEFPATADYEQVVLLAVNLTRLASHLGECAEMYVSAIENTIGRTDGWAGQSASAFERRARERITTFRRVQAANTAVSTSLYRHANAMFTAERQYEQAARGEQLLRRQSPPPQEAINSCILAQAQSLASLQESSGAASRVVDDVNGDLFDLNEIEGPPVPLTRWQEAKIIKDGNKPTILAYEGAAVGLNRAAGHGHSTFATQSHRLHEGGTALSAVGIVIDTLAQWDSDARERRREPFTTTQRVIRAGTTGVLEGGATAVGAAIGGHVGAAMGTAAGSTVAQPIAGAAIGGAAGAVFVGSQANRAGRRARDDLFAWNPGDLYGTTTRRVVVPPPAGKPHDGQ